MLACATLMSCASTKPASVPPSSSSLPAPYDTKYEFRLVSATLMDEYAYERMFWIDNDRLVFRADGYEGGKKVEASESGCICGTTAEVLAAAIRECDGICYTDGELSYFARRGDRRLSLEGSLGGDEGDAGFVCECAAARALPGGAAGTIPAEHLPGGGFLEDRRLAPGGALPLLYYPKAGAEPIELPINPLFTGISLHRYSEYTRSHIFKSSVFDRASRTTAVLQILPDGTIHKLALTDGPWSRGVRVPLPTARGWLLATPLDGVYLMRGRRSRRSRRVRCSTLPYRRTAVARR
ncbi:MAG: hypothetical protein U1F45_08830 [Burkholderiales bacterium]